MFEKSFTVVFFPFIINSGAKNPRKHIYLDHLGSANIDMSISSETDRIVHYITVLCVSVPDWKSPIPWVCIVPDANPA